MEADGLPSIARPLAAAWLVLKKQKSSGWPEAATMDQSIGGQQTDRFTTTA
jgi:hypothetical protein